MEKNISPIKQRILLYADSKQYSKRKLYLDTGIANGVFDKTSGLTEDNIERFISTYIDVNPEWLITGNGNMLKTSITKFNHKSDDGKTTDRVPLYNIEAVAGIVAIFEDLHKQEPIDYIEIPNLPACDGAVYVTGDSMYPLLKSGDIVAYKVLNDKANLFWGEMYLLSILLEGDQFITVKYVQKSTQEGWIKLVSQNSHHQEKEIPFDAIKFAALVKASIRINSMG
ncbi:MAG TPA: S24 family peptidase [Williamwhitmania sp.]|nr:S24 family peptidase [Williamwhitmania sp.]